jgi:hypothetical protein
MARKAAAPKQQAPTEGKIAAMDISMTAAADLGGKTPLAVRVEKAMNDAGEQARLAGAEPDEILRAKIEARNQVMGEVTGEPVADAPAASKSPRKGARKASKAPKASAQARRAKAR